MLKHFVAAFLAERAVEADRQEAERQQQEHEERQIASGTVSGDQEVEIKSAAGSQAAGQSERCNQRQPLSNGRLGQHLLTTHRHRRWYMAFVPMLALACCLPALVGLRGLL